VLVREQAEQEKEEEEKKKRKQATSNRINLKSRSTLLRELGR
jgi:hypothetical protein